MRGAALSGGGFLGNFHIGALEEIADREEKPYGALMGVSAGALIVEKLAEYRKADFREAVADVRDIWTPITNKDIHKRHCPFGALHALWKSSIRNSKPLAKLVQKGMRPKLVHDGEYIVGLGAVNLDTGEYEIFREDFVPLHLAVLASSSYPLMFEPVHIPGKGLYTDGGVHSVTPLSSLIALGCTEIDVFMTAPKKLTQNFEKDPETIDVAIRSFEVMTTALTWKDVKLAQLYNRLCVAGEGGSKKYIKMRIFAPDESLPADSLDFVPKKAVKLQEIGRNVAKRVLG